MMDVEGARLPRLCQVNFDAKAASSCASRHVCDLTRILPYYITSSPALQTHANVSIHQSRSIYALLPQLYPAVVYSNRLTTVTSSRKLLLCNCSGCRIACRRRRRSYTPYTSADLPFPLRPTTCFTAICNASSESHEPYTVCIARYKHVRGGPHGALRLFSGLVLLSTVYRSHCRLRKDKATDCVVKKGNVSSGPPRNQPYAFASYAPGELPRVDQFHSQD
jgi:hypothetical protein